MGTPDISPPDEPISSVWHEWPTEPPYEGTDMKIPRIRKPSPEEVTLYLVLALMGAIGVILVLVTSPPGFSPWPGLVREIGTALLTAAALGATVQMWFHGQIIRDVFRAAIGHFLPPELKPEVHWITGFKCISTRFTATLDIADIGNGIVEVAVEMDRTLKNVSNVTQPLRRTLMVDDWGVPNHSSKIASLEATRKDQPPEIFLGEPSRNESGTLIADMGEYQLRPDEEVRIFSKFFEYKHYTDMWWLALLYPTSRPEIYVRTCPAFLSWGAGFEHHEDKKKEVAQGGKRVTLPGTLMPNQIASVRWWPKKDATINS